MSRNGYKTTFMEKCVTFTINIRGNFTNYFSAHRSTKHFDWVSADYNGYYIQEPGKLDKYGFSRLPA